MENDAILKTEDIKKEICSSLIKDKKNLLLLHCLLHNMGRLSFAKEDLASEEGGIIEKKGAVPKRGFENITTIYWRNKSEMIMDYYYQIICLLRKSKFTRIPFYDYELNGKQEALVYSSNKEELQELLADTRALWDFVIEEIEEMHRLSLGIVSEDSYQDKPINLHKDYLHFAENIYEAWREVYACVLKIAFLLWGSFTLNKHEKKIEIRFTNMSFQDLISKVLDLVEIKYSVRENNNYSCIYFKKGEYITRFLAYISAYKAVLIFEENAIERELNQNISRATNCDVANIERQVKASTEQIDFLTSVIENDALMLCLTDEEREIIYLRLQLSTLSLSEFGKALNPPRTKSQINYLFKKIKRKLGYDN